MGEFLAGSQGEVEKIEGALSLAGATPGSKASDASLTAGVRVSKIGKIIAKFCKFLAGSFSAVSK